VKGSEMDVSDASVSSRAGPEAYTTYTSVPSGKKLYLQYIFLYILGRTSPRVFLNLIL
jgi:hypothetical protein